MGFDVDCRIVGVTVFGVGTGYGVVPLLDVVFTDVVETDCVGGGGDGVTEKGKM